MRSNRPEDRVCCIDFPRPQGSHLKSALNHLLTNVLPAAQDYDRAENELSAAFAQNAEPAHWATAGQHANRRAAEVAVAIDGLADRAANDLGITPDNVRNAVALCSPWKHRAGVCRG